MLWLGGIAIVSCISLLWILRRVRRSRHVISTGIAGEIPSESINDISMLSSKSVQQSLAAGAPPIPWMLRKDDRESMAALAAYFARAIPTPTSDGRVTVRETVGYGGPQLELYVPVLSTKSPVAALARSWDSEAEDLEALLFFFGSVNQRLSEIVAKLGFEKQDEAQKPYLTVFRNRRRFARQRAG
jgi:hypothetical protein